jgi:hypothetical protein
MRMLRRHRREACPTHRLGCGIATLIALAPALSGAFEFQAAPPANLDFSNLGRIGIAGDFNGISLYEFEEQNGRPIGTNGSESLLGLLPNGAIASIVSSDATIRAMCTFMLSNGDMQGVVIGGNFTSLDGTQSTAIALFDPETAEVTPLDGLEGEVNAIYCDQERDTVYVGGNFRGANSTNAIAWYGTEGWTNLPFAGFNGPVEAIERAPNGHIIFGGTFTGLGNASAPSEPDGQSINLSTANITAQNSADDDNVSDPKNIVCSGSADERGTWLLQDNTAGTWDAEFGFGFEPTKLRLWNTHADGRGTRTFRFIAFPINGIMNFTYVDPATGDNKTCTSECPLSDDSSVEFQDFHFVNRVGMNSFQLAISDWYGAGAGLDGIELFQDNIFSYAIRDFNEPACGSIDFPSTATATGPWTESPSLESNSRYLTTELTSDTNPDGTMVVFIPNIRESGNYSVNMYTPGCVPDDTCLSRGRVNVTGTMSGSSEPDFSTTLYQTNNFDKYDQIYFGYIEKTSDTFKPSVTISPLVGEVIDGQVLVAQRVGFQLLNSTGGLNGLFDFDPDQAVVDTSDFEDSAINQLGAGFDPNTGVKTIVTSGDLMFIGGNFTSDEHSNVVAINRDEDVQPLDGGLNGQVFDMHLNGTKLYVGGEFNNTLTRSIEGLNNVAVYDVDEDTWSALGGGVDGRVQYVVPLLVNITENEVETVIAFTGTFGRCIEFGDSDAVTVDGFAIWVPSAGNWLQNLDGMLPSFSGILTAALFDVPNSDPIFAGSLSSAQFGLNSAATLSDDGLGQFPVTLQAPSSSTRLSRRDIFSSGDLSGVVAGMFHEDDDYNITILAGHFSAESGEGTSVNNLVIIDGNDGDAVYGPGSEIDTESTFVTVDISGDILYAGGNVSGTIDGNDIVGLIAYDLSTKSFSSQPSSVEGGNATVSAISVRRDTSDVFVGGSFTSAGGLDCPGICLYNAESSQWTRPGGDVGGIVHALLWSSDSTLVVAGNLTNGDDRVSLAIYNAEDESWENYPGFDKLPGPVDTMTSGSNDRKQLWVSGSSTEDGSTFVMKYDGGEWLTADVSFSADTVVRSLQVFSVSDDHEESDILEQDQVLMLTGTIGLPEFGMAAAVLFNGSGLRPYALTTSGVDNGAGSITKIFTQNDDFFTTNGRS